MRIISDFQDYYDSALALGIDGTRIYHRLTNITELKTDKAPEPWARLIAHEDDTLDLLWVTFLEAAVRPIFICFCGKVYPALQMSDDSSVVRSGEKRTYATYYDCESAYAALQLHSKDVPRTGRARRRGKAKFAHRLNEFFSLGASAVIQQRLVDDRIAVAILMPQLLKSTLVVDARLADVQFFKVVDSWTAFQELDMFWGGVLTPESKPVVPVSETDRLFKHGFDRKSFRKPPSKTRR